MPNKSYQKGYRFQLRVKKHLEKAGFYVQINPKSRFPDGIAVSFVKSIQEHSIFLFECKDTGSSYISKDEQKRARDLFNKYHLPFRVYWNNKGKIDWYPLINTFNVQL